MKKKILGLLFSLFLLLNSVLLPSPALAADTINCANVNLNYDAATQKLTVNIPDQAVLNDDPFILEYRVDGEDVQRSSPGTTNWTPSQFSVADAQSRKVEIAVVQYNQDICTPKVFALTPEGDVDPISSSSGSDVDFDVCQQVASSDISINDGKTPFQACTECFEAGMIWTAIGCIPYSDTVQTVQSLVKIGVGIAGMTVIIILMYGSFMLSTSQGDPKRVDEAKGAISSAVMGAMFIIFSVAILRFIGVTIFQLPAFG